MPPKVRAVAIARAGICRRANIFLRVRGRGLLERILLAMLCGVGWRYDRGWVGWFIYALLPYVQLHTFVVSSCGPKRAGLGEYHCKKMSPARGRSQRYGVTVSYVVCSLHTR